MACYHPLAAWVAKERNKSGKRSVVFSRNAGFTDRPVSVPCGTCLGCQMEKARRWAVRCSHEASLYRDNCFVTLTYSPENVPPEGSLRPKDFVDFMKRLRWKYGDGIRFFQCGEYGANLGRPHHHALLFNHAFPDLRAWKGGGAGQLWRSSALEELWPFGFCSVGTVTFQSAGYVARYAMKKVRGSAAEVHYGKKVPEYLTMSRRPGIGRGWIEKYATDVYPEDELVINGVKCKPPRYYDDVMAKEFPEVMEKIKVRRMVEQKADVDNHPRRLVVREKVKRSALSLLNRDMEAGND